MTGAEGVVGAEVEVEVEVVDTLVVVVAGPVVVEAVVIGVAGTSEVVETGAGCSCVDSAGAVL